MAFDLFDEKLSLKQNHYKKATNLYFEKRFSYIFPSMNLIYMVHTILIKIIIKKKLRQQTVLFYFQQYY